MKFFCLFLTLIFTFSWLPVQAADPFDFTTISLPDQVDQAFYTGYFSSVFGQPVKLQETDAAIECIFNTDLPAQSCHIQADEKIVIEAADPAGLLYGINILNRMARASQLVKGSWNWSPVTRQRAVLLDMGRKYYSKEEIFELLDLMAENCLNALVLHFSESSGLRIESRKYPWLAGSDIKLSRFPDQSDPDENRILTQEELAEIAAYAHARSIELIPSLDSPGHSGYILQQILENTGQDFRARFNVSGSAGEIIPNTWDLSKPEARKFLQSIIDEYALLFYDLGSRTFDMGGDEMLGSGRTWVGNQSRIKWQALDSWQEEAVNLCKNENAAAYDLFIWYMNDLNRHLRGLGYTQTRMWNDELYRTHDTAWKEAVLPDSSIQVEWWNSDGGFFLNQPRIYIDQGHQLINCTNFYNYYILDPKLRYLGVFPKAIWREYTSQNFLYSQIDQNNIEGSCFCIWADNPTWQSAQEVLDSVKPLLFYNGIKCFDPAASKKTSYSQMENLYEQIYG